MALALGTATGASDAFARLLGPLPPPPGPGDLLGLEHEYTLRVDGRQIDFRTIVHDLQVPGRRLDPGDTNAYRCNSGISLTCDDAEAEIATPPIPVRLGFARAIRDWAAFGQSDLERILPRAVTADGVSTHLSAAMPVALNEAACYLYAQTFAPAVMMLLDRADSYGIDVRPRVGRLEINGEYVAGARLSAVAAFFIGTVKICAAAIEGLDGEVGRETARGLLPPPLRLRLQQGDERYGVRVLRDAFGSNLYKDGRRTLLTTIAGTTITAQQHLELAWEAARTALEGLITSNDEAAIDDIVTRRAPLGIEEPAAPDGKRRSPTQRRETVDSPFGRVLKGSESSRLKLRTKTLTWDYAVFEIDGLHRTVCACVPRVAFEPFLGAFERGELDRIAETYAAAGPSERLLRRYNDTRLPGLWDGVPFPGALLPEEYGLEQFELGAAARSAAVSPVYRAFLDRAATSPAAINGAIAAGASASLDGEPDAAGRLTLAPEPSASIAEFAATDPLVASTARPNKYTRERFDGGGGDRIEDGGGWNWWLLLIPGLIVLIVISIIIFWIYLRGPDDHSIISLPTATETAEVIETPPEPSPPAETPNRPALSGTYTEDIVVELDPAGHDAFIDMPERIVLQVLITRDTSTGVITIEITGPPPWVALQGTAQFGPDFTATGGGFTATGRGTVAGFADVAVDFSGSITASGGLEGVLRMGINGELPTGQAISYTVAGERQ